MSEADAMANGVRAREEALAAREEEYRALIQANVRLADEAGLAEARAAAAMKAMRRMSDEVAKARADRDELAIRAYLDVLAKAGFPSTIYEGFSSDLREQLLKRLTEWAAQANEVLGGWYALPEAGLKARDERYREQDEAGVTIIRNVQPDEDKQIIDAFDLDAMWDAPAADKEDE